MPTSIKQFQSRLFDLHSNKLFEITVIFIIVFSALVTGVKTYEINSTLNQLVLGLDRLDSTQRMAIQILTKCV